MKLQKILPLAVVTLVFGFAQRSEAYFSTIDTGEMLSPGSFQASIEPQLVTSRYDGMNLTGRFDQGFDESSSVRGLLGFGKVDFEVGGFYKYVPFPDTATQPSIGGQVGVLFARVGGETEFSVRLHPLVSKRFEVEIGDLIPYASIPFGFTTRGSETTWPVQAVIGSELRALNTPQLSYFAEIGFPVNKSFTYISFALAYRFDEAGLRRTRTQ